MNKSRLTSALRSFYIAFSGFALLSLLFCYYLFVYVARQEREMKAHHFRVLQNMDQQLGSRINDMGQLAQGKLQRGLSSGLLKPGSPVSPENSMLIDSSLKHPLFVDTLYEAGNGNQQKGWDIYRRNGRQFFRFYLTSKPDGNKLTQKYCARISTPVDLLMQPILCKETFSTFLLLDKTRVLFSNNRDISEVMIPDSLVEPSRALTGNSVKEINLNGDGWHVFAHPFLLAGNTYNLCGLMPASDYRNEKYSVHGSLILVAVLLLFMILLAFPFIKSLLMSPEETLDTSDILMTLMALFMLCFFYVYLQMYTFGRLGPERNEKRALLTNTSKTIEQAFIHEFDSAWKQLEVFDSAYATCDSVRTDRQLDTDTAQYYKKFKRVFWLNENGDQVAEWRRKGDPAPDPANYSGRDYFKMVKNKTLWNIGGVKGKAAYLDPLFSWKDGTFRAVLSKPASHKSTLVAAISADMQSVINAVLPLEVNFSIVNGEGRVLFTSSGREHLDEYITEECHQNEELKAALSLRTDAFFKEYYLSTDCHFYVTAVDNLPLHIVTWTDKKFSRNAHLQIFIFTFLMLLTMMIVFSIALFIFIITKKRPKLIKQPLIDLRWAFPAKKFVWRDTGSIGINLLLLFLSIIGCCFWADQPVTLLLLFILNTGVSVASFCNARLQFTGTGRIAFRAGLACFCITIDMLFFYLDSYYTLTAFVVYELLLLVIIRKLKSVPEATDPDAILVKVAGKMRLSTTPQFYHIYALQLVTWFMLITMLPTTCFFRYFYREENRDKLKYMQIELARQFRQHPGNTASLVAYHETSLREQSPAAADSCIKAERADSADREQQLFHEFLNTVRFAMNTPGVHEMQNGLLSGAEHKICFSTNGQNQVLHYHSLMQTTDTTVLEVKSRIPGLSLPEPGSNPGLFVSYLLAPFIFLILFYGFILVFLKRFFMFGFFPQKSAQQQQQEFNEYFSDKYLHDKLKLMVLGVPSSGKNDMVKKAIHYTLLQDGTQTANKSASPDDFLIVYDLAELDVSDAEDIVTDYTPDKIVLLKHFEHDLTEKTMNDAKFRFIADLFQGKVKHVIMLSSIHPSIFLNKLQRDEKTFDAEDYISAQEYYNWSGLLSGFELYTKSLSLHLHGSNETVNKETDAPSFVQSALNSSIGRKDPAQHDNAYATYQLSYLYYRALWNSLDRLEKFVMYDLAQDDLANFRNSHGLLSLYNKGLIVSDDIPRIMDISLRNFILAEIKESDIEIEKKETEGGSAWSKFKTPFLILILVVMFFIFITQQESFNKLLAIVTAFTAGIPALMKLFSLIPSSNKQS